MQEIFDDYGTMTFSIILDIKILVLNNGKSTSTFGLPPIRIGPHMSAFS